MAFLFPKLFPGCVQELEGSPNIVFSLSEAMELYWRATSLNMSLFCSDSQDSFSANVTLISLTTLDELVCGSGNTFTSQPGGGDAGGTLYIGPDAYRQGNFYNPNISGGARMNDSEGNGRLALFNLFPPEGDGLLAPITFIGKQFQVFFYRDEQSEQPSSGGGSISVASYRTF